MQRCAADKNRQFELEEYIKQGKPGQTEKSEVWQTAIGLQAVDGLKISVYLLDTAKEHIEGKFSIDEVLNNLIKVLFFCHDKHSGLESAFGEVLR